MKLAVETMRPEAWQAVRIIYQEGIDTGQATFEATVPSWDEWDAGKYPDCRLVAKRGEAIVGWAALSPVSRREVYAGVAEVSVYVAKSVRGEGVGTALLQALIESSENAGLWTLQASMFPENKVSVALHKACGFRIVGEQKKIARHHGVWHDTILLERRSRRVGI